MFNDPAIGPNGEVLFTVNPAYPVLRIYNASGQLIPKTALSGGFNGDVSYFDIQPGTQNWIADGTFSLYNGLSVNGMVRGNAAGPDAGFLPSRQYTIPAYRTSGIYSRFIDPEDPVSSNWVRLQANGQADPSYTPNSGQVILQDGTYANLSFGTNGGTPTWKLIYTRTDGRPHPPFVALGGSSNDYMSIYPRRDSGVTVVRVSANVPRTGTAWAYNKNLQFVGAANLGTNAYVKVGLAGDLYVAEGDDPNTPTQFSNLRRFDSELKSDSNFATAENGQPFAVLPDHSVLLVSTDSLRRLLPNGALDSGFGPFAYSSDSIAGAIATDNMQYIYLFGSFMNFGGKPSSRIARLVNTGIAPVVCDAPMVDATTIRLCGSGQVTLNATADNGCVIEWRRRANLGGAPAFTGASYTFTATATDTLYVNAVCGTGTGQCVSSSRPVYIRVLQGGLIAGLAPTQGPAGTVVTVTGVNLNNVRQVWLNGTPLAYRHVSASQLSFVVPQGATSGKVKIVSGDEPDTCASTSVQTFLVQGTVAEVTMTRFGQSVCDAYYTDPQGAAPYANNQYITQTLTPATPGAKLYAELVSLALADQDQVYIYDDVTANGAALLAILKAGSAATGKFQATNASGALTFRFYANTAGAADGFRFRLACVTGTTVAVPEVVSFTPGRGANGRKITVLGKNLGTVSGVRFNGVSAGFTQSGSYITTTVPVGATSGRISVRSGSDVAISATDFVVIDTVFQASTQTTLCSGVFTDPQGAGQNYLPNQYLTLTLRPTNSESKLRLKFTEFALGAGDNLYVYNGTGPSAPPIGIYSAASAAPDTIKATNTDGALTLRFYANGTGEAAGWTAAISCTTSAPFMPGSTRIGEAAPAAIVMQGLNLAPNPARGQVTVKTIGLEGKPITVYSTIGKQVLAQAMPSAEAVLDLRSLPTGIYLVRCGSHVARLVVD